MSYRVRREKIKKNNSQKTPARDSKKIPVMNRYVIIGRAMLLVNFYSRRGIVHRPSESSARKYFQFFRNVECSGRLSDFAQTFIIHHVLTGNNRNRAIGCYVGYTFRFVILVNSSLVFSNEKYCNREKHHRGRILSFIL